MMFLFLDFFDKENVVIITLASRTSGGTIGDDGKDVEHAKKDTETRTKYKGDGSALPFTENVEGDQETFTERSLAQDTEMERSVMVVGRVGMVMMVMMVGRFMVMRVVEDFKRSTRHVLDNRGTGTHERKDVELLFFNLLVLVVMIHFDGGQSKRLPESDGELGCLLAETGPAHSTTRLTSHSHRSSSLDQRSDVLVVGLVSSMSETNWDRGELAKGDHFDTDRTGGDESGTSHESRNKGKSH